MSSQALPISALNGHEVTRWQGTEMAFSEGSGPADIRWEDVNIPFLQLVQLEMQLVNGQVFRLTSQLEDGTGFHGLFLVELERLPSLNLIADPLSIYRDLELSELPKGKVAVAEVRQEGPNATIEARLDISGAELRFLAGEIHELPDGRLIVVQPDESILVQVNRARPNPSVKGASQKPRAMLPIQSRVVLQSFNGIKSAPADCRPNENYWLLVGARGTVVESANATGRVLVQFDISVSDLGLSCHNPIPNSLYVPESDLESSL